MRENYADFGPTFAAEMLHERHGLTVSGETLRRWMTQAGLWQSRQQRRQFHQPRLRRECFGELVQIDGSEHRCLPGKPNPRLKASPDPPAPDYPGANQLSSCAKVAISGRISIS